MNIETLDEILKLCPGGIEIKHFSANVAGSDVTITAGASIRHPKHGTFQYAKIYVSRPTLKEALESAYHMTNGYKSLVETAP